MLNNFEALLQTLEKGAKNNALTISNVRLFCDSWRQELYFNKSFGRVPLAKAIETIQSQPLTEAIEAIKQQILFSDPAAPQPGKLYIIQIPNILKNEQ